MGFGRSKNGTTSYQTLRIRVATESPASVGDFCLPGGRAIHIPQSFTIMINVPGSHYNKHINPKQERDKMSDYPDRYSLRLKGVVVHVLDVEKATAFIKDRFENQDAKITADEMAVVNGNKGLATVGEEGVGWFADKDGGIPITYWGINGSGGYIDVSVDELRTLISDKTIDLADHVRVFGDRLETNLELWQYYAKGYPQDKMSLVNATMVA